MAHISVQTPQTPTTKQDRFARLFDGQLKTLAEKGVPSFTIEALAAKKNAVLNSAHNVRVQARRLDIIPFIPVIPPTALSLFSQVQLVEISGKRGRLDVQPAYLHGEEPNRPYYIVKVTNGETFRGLSTDVAAGQIRQQGRITFNAYELVALCVHTEVLVFHGVNAAAVAYRTPGSQQLRVPSLYLDRDGQPIFRWQFLTEADSDIGIPAYRNRIT